MTGIDLRRSGKRGDISPGFIVVSGTAVASVAVILAGQRTIWRDVEGLGDGRAQLQGMMRVLMQVPVGRECSVAASGESVGS